MVSGVGAREFVFGGFVLTPALMRLDHDGLAVPLSLAAFNALQILIENRDRVVTKRELLDRVWAGTAVEENSLNQCISSLRKILGDTRKEARFIATVPGAGYRFVMEVTERERKPAIADDDSIPVQSAAPPRISAIVGIFQRHRRRRGLECDFANRYSGSGNAAGVFRCRGRGLRLCSKRTDDRD
jgi:DNA-binding winged helix-turn-helix (wHTH) protein